MYDKIITIVLYSNVLGPSLSDAREAAYWFRHVMGSAYNKNCALYLQPVM